MLLPLLLNNLLSAEPTPPLAPGGNAGSKKRRTQIYWQPAHVPYTVPRPRRRPRKTRDEDLLFLGQ